jgi:tetratricopeptide (TPR) repeat protein
MMTWNPKANELFLKALELSGAGERQQFLDGACAGDAALRAEVEALLDASLRAGSFLESPAGDVNRAVTVDEPIVVERPGAIIGPYKLLEQIGEGGFGVVFMAEQTQPVRRKVALKILKPGMNTRQVVARFEAERQALALMDHPNIAKVLDGGQTGSGRPYFVMDLVKGLPITEYCDQAQLTLRDRLELFVHLCQAVQHAHQKGVIHRDLKPSNVLVMVQDTTPVVKVIDFGVAKALGQELTDKTLFTGFAQMIGTPLYMSPEQAGQSGLDIDTRSDIYSLGVLLYELLTGTTPFDKDRLKEVGYDELRRIIREEEPPRPSTRISTLGQAATSITAQRKSDPKRLSQLCRGELDWIVMKALEKDRTRRYESASAFAADVRRYLQDEPVQACPPSTWYRLGKLVRRNRASLAMAAVILVASLMLSGGIGWAVQKEAGRQAIATAMASQALDETKLWQEREKWPEARAALKRARAVLDSGGGTAEQRQRVVALSQDLDMVERLETIRLKRTRPQGGSLRFEDSGTYLFREMDYSTTDQAYAAAFRDFGLFDVDHLDPAEAAARIRARSVSVELAAALDDWSWVRRRRLKLPADCWRPLVETASLADPDPWRNRVREALAKDDWKALSRLALSANVQDLPPRSVHLLGVNLTEGPRPTEDPGKSFREAIHLLRRAHWYHPDDFWINYELGVRWDWSGSVPFADAALALRGQNIDVLYQIGQRYHHMKVYDWAIEAYETVLRLNPTDQQRASAHQALGSVWLKEGNFDKALAEYRNALRYQSNPWSQAQVHYSTAGTLLEKGKLDKAIAELREAIRLKPELAAAHNNLGIALRRKGDHDGALKAFRQAVRHDPEMAVGHANLADELRYSKDFAGALEHARKAADLPSNEPGHRVALGSILHDLGRVDEAVAEYRKVIRLRPELAVAHYNLGLALKTRGDRDEAIVALEEALRLKPDLPSGHALLAGLLQARRSFDRSLAHYKRAIELDPKNADLRYCRGNCLSDKGDRVGAIKAYREAIDRNRAHAMAWGNLGAELYRQGKYQEAIDAFEQAIAADPKLATAHNGLGSVLEMVGRLDDAIASYRKAVCLDENYGNAHGNLGYALGRQGKRKEGITELEKAIRLKPSVAEFQFRLGVVLEVDGELDQAVAAFRRAIALDPLFADAYRKLGQALQAQGQFTRSLAAFQQAHDLPSRDPNWSRASAQWLRRAERLVELNALLPAVLDGKLKPAHAAQSLDLAWVCWCKKRFVAATRFYREALAAQPRFAEHIKAGFRSSAATVAALAAAGQGTDAGDLGEDERAALRKQAVTWLRADLERWRQYLKEQPRQARAEVEKALATWQRVPSLAGLREETALDRLPEPERQDYRKFWADVETLRRQAGEKPGQKETPVKP